MYGDDRNRTGWTMDRFSIFKNYLTKDKQEVTPEGFVLPPQPFKEIWTKEDEIRHGR